MANRVADAPRRDRTNTHSQGSSSASAHVEMRWIHALHKASVSARAAVERFVCVCVDAIATDEHARVAHGTPSESRRGRMMPCTCTSDG